MPLTILDVHNVAFSKPPIGKRGYDEVEVDAFLDIVGAELARLIKENTDLRDRVERLDQQRRATPVDIGRDLPPLELPRPVMASTPPRAKPTSPSGDHYAQAAKVLGLAQQIADQVTGEAKTEADGMLTKARATSAQLLRDATTKADGMVNDARTRVETMLDDARVRAETMERQSREKAASLERDAVRKHTEIIGGISQEKSVLENKIDELRAFEREYRTRLVTYLESQLWELDTRGSTARAKPGSHQVPEPEVSREEKNGADADGTEFSARNGSPGRAASAEQGTSRRWKPAVGPGGVGVREVTEPWTPGQRSVS